MRTITDRFYTALENQLAEITLSNEPITEQYRASIKVCKKAMTKLKNYVSSYAFQSVPEEVNFFKEIKPQFYSKYIFYINVYNSLTEKPTGGENIQQDYIKMHLAELKTFFDHNRAFYSYYRSGMTQMDDLYYTRGGFDVHAELEDFEEDEQYSTSHDYKLSLFAVMYLIGMAIYLCILIIIGLGSLLFHQVFSLSHKYGQHGLMKKHARKYLPTYLKFKTRSIFYEKR